MRWLQGLGLGWVALFLFATSALASGAAEADPAVAALAQDAAASSEQQLVEKYAPIIGLKDQEEACDEDGEPYYPVAVDVVLDKDDVVLKRITDSSSSSSNDEVVMTAPGATDLYAKGDQYYLDLPGDPRDAGCDYEQWFDANRDGYDPTTYAHIVSNGTDLLAVQYWFFYVFNNFNNTHESDWEMIQILFEVGTAEEALQADPVSIALAQHGGGETADWTDTKLQRDGNHPIVFAAAGSHASQYGQAVYLGWGDNGTGFGCDITTGPTTLVPLTPLLLPSTQPDPNGDYAWLNFAGRWGQRESSEYNGPTGPSTKPSWTSPFVWQAGLRDSSLEVPLAKTFGPAPTDVFCTLSTWGSSLFRMIGDTPLLFISTSVGIIAAIVALTRYAWPTLREAARVYRRRWPTFLAIGAWLVPVSILFNGFQYLVSTYPPGSTVIELLGETSGAYYALALLTLVAQNLASLVVVGPMMIEVYDEMEKGRNLTFREAWLAMWRKFPRLIKSVGLVALIIVALSVTVIGIPIAIWLGVRWMFTAQATMLDDAGVQASLGRSTAAVRGRWWRVTLVSLSLFILGAAPGVLVGLVLLIFGSASVQATNVVSSLIYMVTVPLSILGLTLLYRNRDLTPRLFKGMRRLAGRFRHRPAEEAPASAA